MYKDSRKSLVKGQSSNCSFLCIWPISFTLLGHFQIGYVCFGGCSKQISYLFSFTAFCNNPTMLTTNEIQNQNLTCPIITPQNISSDTPVSCCWMVSPTSGLKLHFLTLSSTDTIAVDEIHANMDVVSIWRGNQTCSSGLQKCPFKVERILFSNLSSVYRMIEIQLNKNKRGTRVINLNLFTNQGW